MKACKVLRDRRALASLAAPCYQEEFDFEGDLERVMDEMADAEGQEQGQGDDFEKDLDRSMEELDRREGRLQTPSRQAPFSSG